jgi:hypothetical protein
MMPPPLVDTLSVILPTEEQTRPLRVCLHSGAAGRRAWESWRAQMGDPVAAVGRNGPSAGTLLPLLLSSVRRNGVDAPPDLLTVLRAAHYREELRSTTVVGICGEAISALAAGGISAIVLKGVALAETVYDDRALRHCHDVDILVRRGELARAARMLADAGFGPIDGSANRPLGDVKLVHGRGLPVELHTRPFRPPSNDAWVAALWSRSREALIAGVSARVLSPADSLLHVCGQAAYSSSRASLLWVCDAWYVIARHPDLDWDVLLEGAVAAHLALPLYTTLRYLATELDAPIPPAVLRRLGGAASADALGRECALAGARSGPNGSYPNLFRHTKDWRSRALLLKWMLLPSPRFVRWDSDARDPRSLLFSYLARLPRYCARHVCSRLGYVR